MKINLKKIFIISREEIYKNRKTISRRTIVFSVIILLLYGAIFAFSMASDLASDNSVYRIATNDRFVRGILRTNDILDINMINEEGYDSSYDAGLFRTVDIQDPNLGLERENYNLMRRGRSFQSAFKSDAAAKNIMDTLKDYNFNLYIYEYNMDNDRFYDLFPVWVIIYDKNEIIADSGRFLAEFNATLDETGRTTDLIQDDIANFQQGITGAENLDFRRRVGDILFKSNYNELTTPGNLAISLPFKSLLFGLLILTPLMFISTGYLSSLYNERIRKRASVLFASPISRAEIIIGKTLPYIVISLIISCLLILAVIRDLFLIIYAIPAILTTIMGYFAISFAIVLLSRSYKEISFLKTSIASVFICYLLLPTLFLSLHDVAFMSPISAVTEILISGGMPIWLYAFSVIPLLLSSIIMFYIFSKIFCEEAMLIDNIPQKLYFAVSSMVKRLRNIFLISFISFPLVVLIESVFLIFLILPFQNRIWPIIAIIMVAAVTEEFVKNVTIYSAYRMNKLKTNPIIMGIVSGTGFAIAEKAILLIMIPELVSNYYLIILPSLIIPFFFHSLTCIAFAAVVRKTRIKFHNALIIPITLHVIYNIAVVALTASAGAGG